MLCLNWLLLFGVDVGWWLVRVVYVGVVDWLCVDVDVVVDSLL